MPFLFRKNQRLRLPMHLVVSALFVPLIVLAVVLTGYLCFRNGQKAVKDVSDQLMLEISARIEDHLAVFLRTPEQINQINADALSGGLLSADNPGVLERHFWKQVQIFDSVTSIYFGNTAGGLVGAGREIRNGDLYVIATEGFTNGSFKKYATDNQGSRTTLLATVPDFDARTRPWYLGALDKKGIFCSDVYMLYTGQDMAIAVSRPVYGRYEKLLGVVSVDLSLSHLNNFLGGLRFGKTGIGFIMERSGLLVASSSHEIQLIQSEEGKQKERISATDSTNLLIRNAAQALAERWVGYRSIAGTEHLILEIEGRRHILQASPAKNEYGLDWIIVSAIPESDFMAQINADSRITALLIVVALVAAVMVCINVARKISRPIMRINASAQSLAQGNWARPVHDVGWMSEISDLTQNFNRMAGQLRHNLESLTAEIAERKKTEEALRENRERLELVLKGADLGLWDWNLPTGKVFFNERWAEMLGYTLDEVEPSVRTWENAVHPDDIEAVKAVLDDHLEGRKPIYRTEHRLRTKSGQWKWISDVGKVFDRDEQGIPVRMVGIHEDITERKQSEELVRKALQEKEVLIKEVHHRVKNNLAVIASLLNLQAKRSADGNVRKSLMESQARVRAMALIHETLYQTRDLSVVYFEEYVRKLIRDLLSLYEDVSGQIEVVFDIHEIEMDIGQAVSCGLIINELVTNAFKYAFAAKGTGTVKISARMVNDCAIELRIKDNGGGLSSGLEWQQSGTLGLRLISLMVDQLHGKWDLVSSPGVEAVIEWPIDPQ
jgi:PAS domain S-box-containing protein